MVRGSETPYFNLGMWKGKQCSVWQQCSVLTDHLWVLTMGFLPLQEMMPTVLGRGGGARLQPLVWNICPYNPCALYTNTWVFFSPASQAGGKRKHHRDFLQTLGMVQAARSHLSAKVFRPEPHPFLIFSPVLFLAAQLVRSDRAPALEGSCEQVAPCPPLHIVLPCRGCVLPEGHLVCLAKLQLGSVRLFFLCSLC